MLEPVQTDAYRVCRWGSPRTERKRKLVVLTATEEELNEHERRLDAIDEASGGECIWRRTGS